MRPARLLLAGAVASAVVLAVAPRSHYDAVTVEFAATSYAVTAPQQVAAVADEVAVVRVHQALGHSQIGDLPTSRYRVEVLERLKGRLAASTDVVQFGGPDERRRKLVLVQGDQQLQPGQVALLAMVHRSGEQVVIPLGGTKLLPVPDGADPRSQGWQHYPAVVVMRDALAALPQSSTQHADARATPAPRLPQPPR